MIAVDRTRAATLPSPLVLVAALAALAFGLVAAGPALALCVGTTAQCEDGEFGAPFEEPTLLGVPTSERCVPDDQGELRCKPTAGTLVVLGDDRLLYWNALEGSENVEYSLAAEFGFVTENDQSRLLALGADDSPSWAKPSPVDGGAGSNVDGIGPCGDVENTGADASLFCSDQVMLHDGTVLAAGGTDYFNDLCVDFTAAWEEATGLASPLPFHPGGSELEGLKNARIFDPSDDTWNQTGTMEFGRWYPAAVTLPDGDVFIASGVTRLVKPIYPEAPFNSGRNVVQTETYDTACGTWSNNGSLAERSLPLFPRLHLLPNGHVYFNAAGQAFNPFGQAYDQALWNIVGSYDPATQTWTDHAIAGFPLQLSSAGLESIATDLNPTNPDGLSDLLAGLAGQVVEDPQALAGMLGEETVSLIDETLGMDLADPNVAMSVLGGGFRGSTFSVMLALRPDADGSYTTAEFLTAGGVQSSIVNPSPGGYLATALSRIDTMDLSGSAPVYSSRATAPLNAPRWYGAGTLLPNGQVLATSGADKDEVWTPGWEIPVMAAELFDPETETWTQVATQHRARTYHNTAVPMRDGRVLVGGHAPITNSYGAHGSNGEPFAPNEGRDPSFEIYAPWYVFEANPPVISSVSTTQLTHGQSFEVTVSGALDLRDVVLMRRPATTHITDADQRLVELRVLGSSLLGELTVAVPGPEVLPPGKYVLYANDQRLRGPVPSEGVAVTVGADVVGACP